MECRQKIRRRAPDSVAGHSGQHRRIFCRRSAPPNLLFLKWLCSFALDKDCIVDTCGNCEAAIRGIGLRHRIITLRVPELFIPVKVEPPSEDERMSGEI